MSGAMLLVVIVATSDAHDGVSDAMLEVARDALGASDRVALREVTQLPDDDAALATAEVLHATAVAKISWDDAAHLHARLHAYVEGAPRWLDRQIGFDAADAPRERGRTLGFALASMVPDAKSPTTPPPSTADPVPQSTPPPLAQIPQRTEEPPPHVVPPIPSVDWHPRGALEVAGIGSIGIGGNAGGIGALLGVRWSLLPRLAARLSGGVRAGEVPLAAASSLLLFGALGLAWESPWRPLPPLSIGVRADALVLWQELSHLDYDDPSPVREAVWMPGADAFVEAFWTVSPNAQMFVGTGTEVALGTSHVYIHDSLSTDIPVVRLVTELGAVARF